MTMPDYQKKDYTIIVFIVVSISVVFACDILSSVGLAIWAFYFIPVSLSSLLPSVSVPLYTAFAATVLISIGYVLEPTEADPSFALLNRSLAVVALWLQGVLGYLCVGGRVAELQGKEDLRLSEERFRLFIQYAPLPIAMFDSAMHYLAYSQRWLSDHGLTDHIIGQCHYAVLPDYPAHWKEAHQRALAGECVAIAEDCFERPDGTIVWLRCELQPWFDVNGQVGGIIIYNDDITKRKRIEQDRERFFKLVERSNDFISIANAYGYLVYINPAGRKMIGKEENEELIDHHFSRHVAPESVEFLFSTALPRVREHGQWQGEIQLRHMKTGELIDVARSTFRIPGAAGDNDYFGSITRDITEQKRAAELLARRENEMRKLIDALPVLVAYIDSSERYRIVNKTYEQWYARPCSEVEGMQVREMIGESLYPQLQPKIARALQGECVNFELTLAYPDGKQRYIRSTCVPDIEPDGNVNGMFAIVEDLTEIHQTAEALRFARDNIEKEVQVRTIELTQSNVKLIAEIADRKLAEQALAESELRFRRMADTAPVMISLIRTDRTCSYMNAQARQFFGDRSGELADSEGWAALVHPADRTHYDTLLSNAFANHHPFECEYRLRNAEGQYRWVIERAAPRITPEGYFLGYVGTCADITDRREAEKLRLEAAVAQRTILVREVHHRIKNHLQGLVGLLERLEMKSPEAAHLFQQAAAQTRVIATVHGLQAQSMTSTQPYLDDFITAIVDSLRSLAPVPLNIQVQKSLTRVSVEEISSVPIALVVNELVLNAVKHGRFGPGHPGVKITVSSTDDKFTVLIGNPGLVSHDLNDPTVLRAGTGLNLVRLLLPHQGTQLRIEQSGAFVVAILDLTAPVITPKPLSLS